MFNRAGLGNNLFGVWATNLKDVIDILQRVRVNCLSASISRIQTKEDGSSHILLLAGASSNSVVRIHEQGRFEASTHYCLQPRTSFRNCSGLRLMRMEPKHKLIATASFGERNKNVGVIEDRLSSLPDEVVHHIFNSPLSDPFESDFLLNLKDLVLFSCASKRCRQLFLSNPTLNFCEFPEASMDTWNTQSKLMNSLDRLLVRRGDNKIELLDICWTVDHDKSEDCQPPCPCQDKKFRVMTWVHNALLKCNLEKLYLSIECFDTVASESDGTLSEFPSYIFHWGSLRSLFLHFNCKIQTPSFAFSSNIKQLTLIFVNIADEGFFKWISCCCKCIEELYLDFVYGMKNVTIESSSLQSFRFHRTYYPKLCHLHVSGEKLKDIYIDWSFDSATDKSLDISAPNLKNLLLRGNLVNRPNLGQLPCLEKAEIRLQPKVDGWSNTFEVLRSLRSAKVVMLSEEVIQTSGFNMDYWKHQDVAFFNQLKEITIELVDGNNGIELARYILEHANHLEKMIIIPSEHSNVEEELRKSKMISNAALVFESQTYLDGWIFS